tara:strand:- start:101 stop:316 length:216 start_codon:yes stop_codon:yes gene_type:complete
MSDVVWSINIMCVILLVGVAVCIYWIFKYDDWYPNPIPDSDHNSPDEYTDARRNHTEDERLEVGTEQNSSG